ncbi:MAG: hypothetical protein NWF04_10205 [Candidatus Bathyarchaeota archaeon]|nr:hypothetical protein [Candidatus Bathyarchaeota archaeon]
MFVLFLAEVITLCLLVSFRHINAASTVTLLIFNFLFVSLIFQLRGSRRLKLILLTVGNILGVFWNFVFFYFSAAGIEQFGMGFNVFYTLAFPVLNLMWIVPFWSISLGVLPNLPTDSLEVCEGTS